MPLSHNFIVRNGLPQILIFLAPKNTSTYQLFVLKILYSKFQLICPIFIINLALNFETWKSQSIIITLSWPTVYYCKPPIHHLPICIIFPWINKRPKNYIINCADLLYKATNYYYFPITVIDSNFFKAGYLAIPVEEFGWQGASLSNRKSFCQVFFHELSKVFIFQFCHHFV